MVVRPEDGEAVVGGGVGESLVYLELLKQRVGRGTLSRFVMTEGRI